MCVWRNQTALAFCAALLITLLSAPAASRADVTTWLDFSNFDTRLNELTTSAGVSAFNAGEIIQLRSGIQQKLETAYSSYDVTFSTVQPSGLFETLNFGLTASAGSLGLADRIDYRNQVKTDVGRIFTANFDFIIEANSSRATQIQQLTSALAGTAAHEFGHNLGLMHEDSYGDPSIVYNGSAPVPTFGIQNTHIMATGRTGLNELGRETDRSFSRLSQAKLDYADGLGANTPTSTNEQGGAHGSTGTAQLIDFAELSSSGLLGRNVIGSINSEGESDFYSFDAVAGAIFTADLMSGAIFGNDVDSIMTLYDIDGTSLLGQNDDIVYNADFYGTGSGETLDSGLLNITLTQTGRYFLEISGFGTSTGNYELLMAVTPVAAVPEPSTALIFGLGGAVVLISRRRRRVRIA